MATYFRFAVSSVSEVRQFLGIASYIVDIRPHNGSFEIMIRDTSLDRLSLDRFYFLETSASIAAEFDN